MLARLNDQIALCHEQASLARLKAVAAKTAAMRTNYQRLESSWLRLAESLAFAERVSAFLQWNSLRLQPPEAFTATSNQESTPLAANPAAKIEELATWRKERKGRRRGAARRTRR